MSYLPAQYANRRRLCWLILLAAMAVAAGYLLYVGRELTFSGDELYYYAHLTAQGTTPVHAEGLEYFLSPHNGHFVLLGRLIYELLFALAGTDYVVFRIAEVLGVLVSVGLVFELTSRRVDPFLALAPCVLLLFFGYAYETLLWPFNLHTVYALAFGLGALLALERDDRVGDVLACLLLVCSVATVEVGLAFVAGVAVSVLLRDDRWKRIWIPLAPAVLYGLWWLWARKFHQPAAELTNVHLIPADIAGAFTAVVGSLTGLNPTGVGIQPEVTGVTPLAAAAAGLAALGLGVRIWRGKVPPLLWLAAATVVAYWITIALGGRFPDSSRYLFVGASLLLVVGAWALYGRALPGAAIACVALVALLAIPPNLAKLYDGRRLLINDAKATRTEDAMIELARDTVDPAYVPGADPRVSEVGGGVITLLTARDYLRGAQERSPLAYSLEQVREVEPPFRAVADATLVGALGLTLESSGPPPRPNECEYFRAADTSLGAADVPSGGAILSASNRPVKVSLRRFETDGTGVPVGEIRAGRSARLRIPADAAQDPWQIVFNAVIGVCPLG